MIPAELRALPRWCVAQVVKQSDGSSKKFILTAGMPGRHLAASDDPGTWRDFATAERDARVRGLFLTYVFDRSRPEFFIDADEVVDPATGEITADWARDLVEGLETYTEISASGDGLHIIGRGVFGGRSSNPAYPVERYPTSGARFCLFTGNVLPGYETIEERQRELSIAFPTREQRSNGSTTSAAFTGATGDLLGQEMHAIVQWAIPFWGPGRRNPLALCLSGYLGKEGVPRAQGVEVIRQIGEGRSNDLAGRLSDANDSYDTLESGGVVTGWQGLHEKCHLSDEDLEPLAAILAARRARLTFTTGGVSSPAAFVPEFITDTELMAATFPEPRWAVPGIIPDGLTLLVGRPKQGKSWLLFGMGLSIAFGGKALGQADVEGGDVLLLCLEDNRRRLQDRMRMLLDGQPTSGRLHLTTAWPRLDQGGGELLDQWLTDHPTARLVGIDVLQRMRAKSIGEGRLYEQDYEAMSALKKIADAHGVALVVVHHSRKSDADDPFDLISGTTGLAGGVDTGLILMRERGQADANLYIRGRDVNEQDLALSFDERTGMWNLLGDADTYRLSQQRLAIITALRDHGPMSAKEVALSTGQKEGATRKNLSMMVKDQQITNTSGKYSVVPWE